MPAQQTLRKLRLKPIALSIAISSLLPLSAQAGVLELFAQGTYALVGGATNTVTQGPRTSGYVDVLTFPSSGPNQAGIHTYGSDQGDFGSRSSGAGIYDVTGLFRIRESITNSTGAAQSVQFNFNITPGQLSNELNSGFAAGDFVNAAIKFDIGVNRGSGFVQQWFSQASLRSDATDGIGQFAASGNDTGFYVQSAGIGGVFYEVQSFSKTLDLGILNPGESLELKYEISSLANGISTSTGGITVPEQTVTIPGYWTWAGSNFAGGEGGYGGGLVTPGQAINGECSIYGGAINTAVVDPNTPPTNSPCWVYVPPRQETIPEYISGGGPVNGSGGQSGDPFGFGSAGYYTGILPLQGGLTAADIPEPGTLPLLGLALGGLWLARRRRYN